MLTFNDAGRTYRINELAKELDRSAFTIKKWEAERVIPKAKRDSRGWRYYTEKDIIMIRRILEEKGYLSRSPVS